jgi:ABC-type iron transport system FetAB permease component
MITGMLLLQAAIILGIVHWISKRSSQPEQIKTYLTLGLLVLIFGFLLLLNWVYSKEPNWFVILCLLVILISACVQLRKRKEKS